MHQPLFLSSYLGVYSYLLCIPDTLLCLLITVGVFETRCKELGDGIQIIALLKKQLTHENHDLEARIKSYEQERAQFEEERAEWKEESERAKNEIIEQNDRLTVLSQRLTGTKVCMCMHVHI